MKLTNKLFILFIFITNICCAQDWVKTAITDFASINFPVKSELTETTKETVYTAEDEFAFYMVSIRKLTDQQSSQITKEDVPKLYQGVVKGAMDAANGKVVSMNEILIQKNLALELEYNAPANPELPSQRFKRIIYLNQSIVTLDFWPLTNQKDVVNEKKAKYFNSFLINSVETEKTSIISIQKNDKSNSGFETGFFIGQIIFFVILLAFLIGIIFLIRYLIKKNRKKKSPIQKDEQLRSRITKINCKNCNSENKNDNKYCSKCGYELPKI